MKVLVAKSHPTLCDPVDCCPPGSSVHGILQARYWDWLPFPSPGDLPDSEIELTSPTLQVDSSPSEPVLKLTIAVYQAYSLKCIDHQVFQQKWNKLFHNHCFNLKKQSIWSHNDNNLYFKYIKLLFFFFFLGVQGESVLICTWKLKCSESLVYFWLADL